MSSNRGSRRLEIEMHPYQDDAVRFVLDNPFSALWMDMGLGKTVTILTALRDLIAAGQVRRTLVVAPLKVATQTWPNEFQEWKHLAHIPHTIIRDDDVAVRLQLLRAKTPIHIINREMLKWLVDTWAEARRWPYDCMVIDESSSFKDHTTERWKSVKRVRRLLKRLHLLTATPASQSYMGLFAQYYLLDRGERFGNTIGSFRKKYFEHNVYAKSYTILPHAKGEIVNKVSDITLVMREEDYLDVKKPLPLKHWITLTDAQMAAYRRFEKKFVLKLPDGPEIEALTAAALSQKLLQCASGAVYDEARTPHFFHDHKIRFLEEIVESLEGSPIMVAYWFKSSRERLKKAFPQAVVMDRHGRQVDPWNRGEIPILLVHPQSAGHGLNMQKGPGHNLAFFDMFWSGELYQQIIKRIARQGQQKVVRVHHLLTRGTHDEDAMARQESMGDEERALKRAVLRIRDRIRKR